MESKSLSSSFPNGPDSSPSTAPSSASSVMSVHPTYSNKRLIVCCDGTWQDSDSTFKSHPTNVTRLSRCFKQVAGQTTQQIVYYQSGVGTGGGTERLTGGAFGSGIGEHIREAYAFLCTNWAPGDEIVLIGFSRGAFTARSIAGMVTSLGLLTVAGLDRYAEIFSDMQTLFDRPWTAKIATAALNLLTVAGMGRYAKVLRDIQALFDKPGAADHPEGKPSISDFPGRAKDLSLLDDVTAEYRTWLRRKGLTRVSWADNLPDYTGRHPDRTINIKAVAVFDTVGSLGIPDMSPWHILGLHPVQNRRYQFWDTSLSPVIENSFHALALDETRTAFSPTIWEQEEELGAAADADKKSGRPKPWLTNYNVKQVWFPGGHSDVGGGSEKAVGASIANMSLAWMLDQLSSVGCEFDYDIVELYFTGKKAASSVHKQKWSFGTINSAIWLSGLSTRRPMQYTAGELAAGKDIERFLWATNETIHSSARLRLQMHGPNKNNMGTWPCKALADWELRPVPKDAAVLGQNGELYLERDDTVLLSEEDMPVSNVADLRWSDVDKEVCQDLAGTRKWVWKYIGPQDLDNHKQVGGFPHTDRFMYEEPLGPFERYLLYVCDGKSLFRTVDESTAAVVQPPKRRFVWLTMQSKELRRFIHGEK